VVATAATSIRKLKDAGEKRAHLWENSRRLHQGLRDLGFELATPDAQSAIIAVLLPDQDITVRMWQALLEQGVYVNMARPPATPAGMYLLRCSLCAEHSKAQVGEIIAMFEAAGRATGVLAGGWGLRPAAPPHRQAEARRRNFYGSSKIPRNPLCALHGG
jgi:7-keto-8-aminopelargonate synthetase-like enzyme